MTLDVIEAGVALTLIGSSGLLALGFAVGVLRWARHRRRASERPDRER